MKVSKLFAIGKIKLILEDGSIELLNNVSIQIDSPGKITLGSFGDKEIYLEEGIKYKFNNHYNEIQSSIEKTEDRTDQVKVILQIVGQSLNPSEIYSILKRHKIRMPNGNLITQGGARGAIRRAKNKGKIIANSDGTYKNNEYSK